MKQFTHWLMLLTMPMLLVLASCEKEDDIKGDPDALECTSLSGLGVPVQLSSSHVITEIIFKAADQYAPKMKLGIFEGANNQDFSDAVPVYMITEDLENGKTYTVPVSCSKGFTFMRYVGPDGFKAAIGDIVYHGREGEGNESQMYQVTNLPLVVIHTENHKDITSKETYLKATISTISNGGKDFFTASTKIRGRGNASWNFPKKPYRIKLDEKASLLGMPATEKNWTLINNYGDKSLFRNLLAFDVSRSFKLAYTPAGKMVDVMLNGEYKGTYQLCDQMEVGKKRVNVTKMKKEDETGEALTGGYFIEVDAYAASEDCYFNSLRGIPVTIKHPDSDDITDAQKRYIQDYFNVMEGEVFKGDFTHLDKESFIRYFLMGEVTGNTDTFWSTYMYKERGDNIIRTGPGWDFDLAFENDKRTYPLKTLTKFLALSSRSSAANGMKDFVKAVVACSDEEIKAIWKEARDGGLSADYLISLVDAYAAEIEESQKLNFTRWPILNEKVHQNIEARGTYAAEVEAVKTYIRDRFTWLDNFIGY